MKEKQYNIKHPFAVTCLVVLLVYCRQPISLIVYMQIIKSNTKHYERFSVMQDAFTFQISNNSFK